MNRFLTIAILVCINQAAFAQYIYTIKADSVKITNDSSAAELIIENHTQTVPGCLFNKGFGRTEFRKVFQKLSDTAFLIGGDTIKLRNIWLQGGNRFGTTGMFGTLDNNPVEFYTNATKRASWTSDGKLFINDNEDLGLYKLQVNGSGLFRTGVTIGTDDYKISLIPDYTFAYEGPRITFGSIRASIGVNKQVYGNIPANSLLFGQPSPANWTAMVDSYGNPTFVTQGGGEVTINGGYYGITTGGTVGITTDAAAHPFQIYGGRGTGAGQTGDIQFYTGNAQPSGATIHSMTAPRWTIKGGTGYLTNATNPSSVLDITGANGYSQLRLRTSYTPTSTSDTNGNVGDFSWDDNYFYIRTNAGWKRAPLTAF